MANSDTDREHESNSDRSQARVRVLIVDDSALMRRLLSDLLSSAPEIEIVGTARDGREAVLQAIRLKPDVITLDVEMPEVSGLEALPALLAVHDAPIVMVSALTQEGADITLQALELGAFDFMPKPERNQLAEIRASRDLLVSKVLGAGAESSASTTAASWHITHHFTPHKTTHLTVRKSIKRAWHDFITNIVAPSELDLFCHRYLHRWTTGAESDLSALGSSVTTHPGRSAYASTVHWHLCRAP